MNTVLFVTVGATLGWFFRQVIPAKHSRSFAIFLLVLVAVQIAVEAVPASATWRVHNVPALATENERSNVESIDKIRESFEKTRDALLVTH